MRVAGLLRSLVLCWVVAALLLTPAVAKSRQVLDEVTFRGQVDLGGRMMPYSLHLSYEPIRLPGYPEGEHLVSSISLTIDGHAIVFPKRALDGLYYAGDPSSVFRSYPDGAHGRFEIRGGDGEKSYRVAYVFSAKRLLRRETYRHVDTNPEVMRF